MKHVELLIIGSGITGCCLSIWAEKSGIDFHLVDTLEPSTSSRIAAGMMTPVTGQKLVLSQEFVDHWESNSAFFREMEQRFHSVFLEVIPMIRIFASEEEIGAYQKRKSPLYDQYATLISMPVNPHILAPYGGLFMPVAGRLKMKEFTQAVINNMQKKDCFTQAAVSWIEDFIITFDEVIWKHHDISAQAVVFCDGASYQLSHFYPSYQMTPSKGEILTIRIPDLHEKNIIHHRTWLIPIGGDLYKLGATYEWDDLTSTPTDQGRDFLLAELSRYLDLPVEIIKHEAAIRPTPRQFRPIAQWSTREPRLGMINGLGSKGSLVASDITYHFLKDWRDRRTSTTH